MGVDTVFAFNLKDLFVKRNVYGLMDFSTDFIYNKLLIELKSKDILYIYTEYKISI